MIICKDFIALNFPKTGSTFVREMIKEIYRKRYTKTFFNKISYQLNLISLPYTELLLPNYQSPNLQNRNRNGQHGAYCQIPEEYNKREIVTVARNPYDIFLTSYLVKWWSWFYPIEKRELQKIFVDFPNLTLNEYIALSELSLENKSGLKIGLITTQFIRMYFKEPEKVLAAIDEAYINSDLYKTDIAENITFLRQENLNDELANYLSKHGFSKDETEFIRKHHKVNATESITQNKNTLWTKEAVEYVEYNERFLFRILKDYGFQYKKPVILGVL